MSLYRVFIAMSAVLLLLVPVAVAQDAEWEIVAIAGTGSARQLLTIGPDGIRETAALSPDFPANYEQLAVSPDGRLLATIPAQWNRVVLAPTDGGECCTEFSFTEDEVFLSTLAGFSLDGSQLAISYVSEEPLRSEMLIMDVETGEVVTTVDTTEVSSSDPNFLTYPVLLEWALDGVHYVTSCINCVDAAMPDDIDTWDPATGSQRATGLRYNYRHDRLAFAPASVTPVFALDYPSAADAEALLWGAESFGVRNAVLLTSANAEDGRAIVYTNAEHTNLIARWGANGDAILVFFSNELPGSGELVLPNGSTQPLDFPASQFLAGTPDGWVRMQGGRLLHDRLDGATVTTTELGEYTGAIRVLQAPPLGAHGGGAFVTVPPPEPVTCDGFVESRLVVGHLGRVMPGPANNLRAEPTTASEIIAKMAGSEEFAILEGPVCTQGLAWWRVAFKRWEGWTAEGSGSNYWLEMAPDVGYQAPAG